MANNSVTLVEFLQRCPSDDIEILEYAGLTKPCVYRCLRCLAEYSHKTPDKLLDKRGGVRTNCTCAGNKGSTSLAEFLSGIAHLPYTPIGYTALKTRCDFKCVCGCVFEARPFDLRSGRSTCPECKQRDFADEYVRRLAEEFPHITFIGPYLGVHRKTWHRCECGHEWLTRPMTCANHTRKAGCKYCDYQSGGPRLKQVVFGKRTVQVQGYEDAALRYLTRRGVNPDRLAVRKAEGVPNIRYRYKGEERMYYPDFYHRTKNCIIEVKSIFTLLSVDFKKTCAKARSCIKQGFKFKLLLVNKRKHSETVLHVPANWYKLSRAELVAVLCASYPKLATRLSSLSKRNPFADSQK